MDDVSRDQFFSAIDKEVGSEDRDRIEWAYSLSKNFHRPQTRDSGERYFVHCKSVALTLLDFLPTNPGEIIIALLHDTYEDQFVPRGMVRQLFGESIDDALRNLSKFRLIYRRHGGIEKITKSKEEYYRVLREASFRTRRVKLADRLHNLRTLDECSPDKIARKISETELYIFPLAGATDEKFFETIKNEIDRLKNKKI